MGSGLQVRLGTGQGRAGRVFSTVKMRFLFRRGFELSPRTQRESNEKGINIYNHKKNLAERSSPAEKENDFSMSFIWTVGAAARLLLLPKTHTQSREDTADRADGADRVDSRQKRRSLLGDRETCLARVTAAACVAFHIICLWYGPLGTLHTLPPNLPLSPPPSSLLVLRTYLFMPHVKSQQRAKFSLVLLVIPSAKRRSCRSLSTPTPTPSPSASHTHSLRGLILEFLHSFLIVSFSYV